MGKLGLNFSRFTVNKEDCTDIDSKRLDYNGKSCYILSELEYKGKTAYVVSLITNNSKEYVNKINK